MLEFCVGVSNFGVSRFLRFGLRWRVGDFWDVSRVSEDRVMF